MGTALPAVRARQRRVKQTGINIMTALYLNNFLTVMCGQSIPLLAITDEVVAFSEALIRAGAIPKKAIGDSLHVAMSAVHGINYLLTWNYRHIDNAEAKPIIRKTCTEKGYEYPEICTPQELMGEYENG